MHRLTSAFVLLSSTLLTDRAPAEPPPEAEPHSIIYLSDAGPIVIEIRVFVDGRPLEQAWQQYVDGLYASLDTDASGELSVEEAARLPAANLLQQAGLVIPTGGAVRSAAPDSRPRDGRVTRAELAAYLQNLGGGPFATTLPQRTESGPRASRIARPQGLPADLFKLLDRSGDGKLSADEFALDVQLLKLDRDDDRSLSEREMAPFFNPFLGVPSMQAEQAAQADAFLAIDGGAGLQDVRGLLERFDGAAGDAAAESVAKDNVLTAAEFGVSPEALAEYDVDGSGGLDFDELRQWLRRPPADVTLLVHIGDAANATSLEFTARDTLSGGRLKLRPSSDGGRDTLSVGKVRLEFEGRVARLDAREQVVEPFDRADADGNGYIDLEESRRYVVYSQLFALVDADGDEKLFKAEAEAWADRWAPAFRSRVELAVADRGRRLFDILDANRDGRLGENELRAGAARIADWDADSDGLLVEQEVPGTWGISVAPINVARAVRGIGGGGEVRRIEASAAPNWFRRMDRNGDGLIAQREFLGPLADFSKFDADGDGYLSAAEAGD